MTVKLHVLIGSGHLGEHRAAIERIAGDAIDTLSGMLPISGIDVVFQDLPAAAIPSLGIGGFSPSGHLLQVSLDPVVNGFADKLALHLPRTIAHEWHHCARWRGPGYGVTLGEALVSEGLADHFDLEVNGGDPYHWVQALDEAQVDEWWARARGKLRESRYNHAFWFFNQGEAAPPFHTGYTLGFLLVGAFLARHRETRSSALWNVAAEDIIIGFDWPTG